jgi:hypothetical protein
MSEAEGVKHPIKRDIAKKIALATAGLTAVGVGAEIARRGVGQSVEVHTFTQVSPTETPSPITPTLEAVKPSLSAEAMLFAAGYEGKDKEEYIAQVFKEKENIIKNRYEGGGLAEDKKRVHALQGDIDAAFLTLVPPVASFIKQMLPGLILIESKGDPLVEKKETGAVGLCQITPIVMEDLEQSYPGFVKTKELINASDNIAIAAKYLDHLYKIFPDRALAVWAYHLGQTRMSRSLYNYLVNEKRVLSEQAYDALPPPQTVALVNRFKNDLSVPKFMDSVSLAIEIDHQYTDEGLKAGALRYVPLVAAANELLAA